MSSLLVSLSSKPFLRKLALRCHTLRPFSSSTSTNPYMMYCVTYCGENVTYYKKEYPVAGVMTKLRMYDPAKEDYFTVGECDKPLPKEMVMSTLVGSSHGWGVFLSPPDSILISDYWHPSSSKSNPKIIHLPPRPVLNKTGLVSSVAMSSSPEEEDCVMVVKFTGRLLGIYTPGLKDKGWLLNTIPQVFEYFEDAKLMYSKRDQKFYMPSSGGHHLWSYNIESSSPKFHDLRFHNLPQFSASELQLLDSCYRTHHLVESPSGQRFLVKWYVQSLVRYVQNPVTKSIKFNFGGTKRFLVFREEEDMNMCYTEDIGDLCIFLGNNEPFCVKASSSPGLNPNSIYYLGEGYGEGFGVYDIATRTPRAFSPKSLSAFSDVTYGSEVNMVRDWVPHWVPPVPL